MSMPQCTATVEYDASHTPSMMPHDMIPSKGMAQRTVAPASLSHSPTRTPKPTRGANPPEPAYRGQTCGATDTRKASFLL